MDQATVAAMLTTINQIQIVGSSLFTGIGKNANTGSPSIEQVYNGTIGRIADLNNPVVMNMTTAGDRAAFESPGAGQIRPCTVGSAADCDAVPCAGLRRGRHRGAHRPCLAALSGHRPHPLSLTEMLWTG